MSMTSRPDPHVMTWPGPAGRTFVCLHAAGGSAAHWLAVAPSLAEHGRVIAVDLAGFGKTSEGPDGVGLDASQALIGRILDVEGPAILVGSSFGGGVAQLQAGRVPDSVTGLVLSGSMFPIRGDGRRIRAAIYRHRLRQRFGDVRRAVAAMRDGRLRFDGESAHEYFLRDNAGDPAAMDPGLVQVIMAASSLDQTALRTVGRAGRTAIDLLSDPERYLAVVDAIRCPVLVIHGRSDRTISVGKARSTVAERPGWELVALDDVGHLPHLEAPERWSAAVSDWLARTPIGLAPVP